MSTLTSFVKFNYESNANFWTFFGLYHLFFDLKTIEVS